MTMGQLEQSLRQEIAAAGRCVTLRQQEQWQGTIAENRTKMATSGKRKRSGALPERCSSSVWERRVPGLLQGSDLLCRRVLRFRDVAWACMVAKNVCFPA